MPLALSIGGRLLPSFGRIPGLLGAALGACAAGHGNAEPPAPGAAVLERHSVAACGMPPAARCCRRP
eukprot:4555676-Prorocentrum_lima.AAC.1